MMGRNQKLWHICLLHILTSVLFMLCIFTNLHVAVRLGGHSVPTKGVTVLPGTFPHPVVFYNHFVAKGEPLLMKGVLEDSEHRAFKRWSDDYLRSNFGDDFVYVEKGKKENRKRDVSAINFGKFLDIYDDIDLYMVCPVPPGMQEDVEVPFTLQCGGFHDNLHEAVVWFSGGGTRSVLHYDAADNFLCSLDGMKQVVLIDKKYHDIVTAHDFVELESYSLMDVVDVDQKRFGDILSLPWVQVNITKGDCLYIPYKWFHHIYSPPGRNLAVNTWFSHLWWLNTTDCDGVARGTPSKSLNEFTLASPNEQLRTEFLEAYEDLDVVKHDEFVAALKCEDQQDKEKMWSFINQDDDDHLTWPEMYSFNMDDLVANYPQCFLRPAHMEDVDIQEEDGIEVEQDGDKFDKHEGDAIHENKDDAKAGKAADQNLNGDNFDDHKSGTLQGNQDDATVGNGVDDEEASEDKDADNVATSEGETADIPDDSNKMGGTSGVKFEPGDEMNAEELEEMNAIFQSVLRDTEEPIIIDDIEEEILGGFDVEETSRANENVVKGTGDSGKVKAKPTESLEDANSGKTVPKDVHDEF